MWLALYFYWTILLRRHAGLPANHGHLLLVDLGQAKGTWLSLGFLTYKMESLIRHQCYRADSWNK